MTARSSTENNSPLKQPRVLPKWMTKVNSCSSSKNIPASEQRSKSTSAEEASSTEEKGLVLAEEQAVEDKNLHSVVNVNSVVPKAHQLSDDEEAEGTKKVDTGKEQVKVCGEPDKVHEGQDKVRGEQDGLLAEDKSPEVEDNDGQGNDVASGEVLANLQNSNDTSVLQFTWKLLCNYGAKCYRKNPEHKKDFCHPWDEDYDIVYNSMPACPYGAACYRKNKAHWQTNSHPPTAQRARRAKRTRKPTKAPAAMDSDSEDDCDSVDSFLNDASSDDYQPTDTESDSDNSGDASDEDTSEPDPKRMKKEAKRFVRKKK